MKIAGIILICTILYALLAKIVCKFLYANDER